MKKTLLIIVLSTLFYQCKDTSNSSSSYQEDFTTREESNSDTYHTDSDYKYEHRTGTTGNYEYNYDVIGYDEDGNPIDGNIDISGKSGSGYIYDEYGSEKYIEVEWSGYGELEGYDEDGNYYEMNVE